MAWGPCGLAGVGQCQPPRVHGGGGAGRGVCTVGAGQAAARARWGRGRPPRVHRGVGLELALKLPSQMRPSGTCFHFTLTFHF